MDKYHSQFGEMEFLLDRGMVKLPAKGIYVDVGAHDGFTDNNTYWLDAMLNWDGICIEPHPHAFSRLVQNRKRTIALNVAIGTGPSPAEFYMHPLETWSRLGGNDLPKTGTPIPVTVRRLDDILFQKNIDHIDLLSIDTEGTELDVLQTITLDRYRPQIIIIEWNTWKETKNTEREIMDSFYPHPYRMIHRTEGNLIFERLSR